MAQLLISFCNTCPKGLYLGQFDFDTQDFSWIEVETPIEAEGSAGLCGCPDGFYVLIKQNMHGRAFLGFLNRKLEIDSLVSLEIVRDAHSMIRTASGLLIVSAGSNEIVRVQWDRKGPPIEEVFWSATANRSEDVLHMNSILEYQGQLFVSMFGRKTKAPWIDVLAWDHAQNGQVLNITTGEVLINGLGHPHSLFTLDDGVCVADSRTGRVIRLTQDSPRELCQLEGYVRGIARDGDYLYIAASARRKVSRHTGLLRDVLADRQSTSRCLIYRFHLASGTIDQIRDLTPFGQEIYDLAILSSPSAGFVSGGRERSLIRRLERYDNERIEPERAYAENLKARLIYDAELHRLINEDRNYEVASLLLERLLEKDPENGDWQYHYAYCLLCSRQNYDQAIQHFQQALACGFSEFWVRYHLAMAYMQTSKIDKAEANLNRARELKPAEIDMGPVEGWLETIKNTYA